MFCIEKLIKCSNLSSSLSFTALDINDCKIQGTAYLVPNFRSWHNLPLDISSSGQEMDGFWADLIPKLLNQKKKMTFTAIVHVLHV